MPVGTPQTNPANEPHEPQESPQGPETPGSADPLVGRTLGGYRVDGLLGRGGTGSVYKAMQLSIDRVVALKVLLPELAGDRKFLLGFVQEARAAARLNHPHVVQIHDVCQEGQYLFYSMEYLPGGSLADLLRRRRRVPWRLLVRMLRDAARALLYGEESGIAHRDVNPANLLLTQDQRVKVADLGIATELRRSASSVKKPSAASIIYGAPEELLGGEVDHRADMYALGATFFHALTGTPPFRARTVKEVVTAKTLKEPPEVPQVDDAPPWLAELIGRLMARDPEMRPASFNEVLRALEPSAPAARGAGKKRRDGTRPGFLESPRGRWIVAAAAVLLVGLTVLFVMRSEPQAVDGGPASVSSAGGVSERGGMDDGEAGARKPGAPPEPAPAGNDPSPDSTAARSVPAEAAASTAAAEAAGSTSAAPGLSAPEQAGLKALRDVRANWLSDFLSAEEAAVEIARIQKKHPGGVMSSAAGAILREIQEGSVETRRRVVVRQIEEGVGAKIDAGQYAEAVALLEDLSAKFPQEGAEIQPALERAMAAAGAELAKAEGEAKRLAAEARYGEAAQLLASLEARLPPALEERAESAAAEVRALEARSSEIEKELEGARGALAERLARADFEGAAKLLAGLPQDTQSPALTARREALGEEVRLLSETWGRLLAGARKGADGGIELAFHRDDATAARGTFTGQIKSVVEAAGPAVITIQSTQTTPSGASAETRRLLELDDLSLYSLIARADGTPVSSSTPPPALVKGLGLLLLSLEGPRRALRFHAAHAALGSEDPAARIEAAGKALLEARLADFEPLVASLASQPSATAKSQLAAVVDGAGSLVKEHRDFPHYKPLRERIASLFIAALKAKLRADGPEALFHAYRVRLTSDGKISLRYDFASEDELLDFVPAAGSGAPILEQKTLRLKGEARLLRGNPFRGWLGIKAEVARYKAASPNINFAVWTHEGDQVMYGVSTTTSTVSSSGSGSSSGPSAPPPPAVEDPDDYVVFGVGYRPSYSYEIFLRDPGNLPIATPASAIIGGQRGMPLHSYYSSSGFSSTRWNCLWAEWSHNLFKGQPVVYGLLLKPEKGEFTWYANQRRLSNLALRKDPGLRERLLRADSTGSISLLTNGDTVYFASLTIDSDLDPAWHDAELERLAAAELKKLEPKYPFAKKK
jgi:hypothetical protein